MFMCAGMRVSVCVRCGMGLVLLVLLSAGIRGSVALDTVDINVLLGHFNKILTTNLAPLTLHSVIQRCDFTEQLL